MWFSAKKISHLLMEWGGEGWDHWKIEDELVVSWWILHPEALVGEGSAERSCDCSEVVLDYSAEALDMLWRAVCCVTAHTDS